jgi:phage replication-related protein YjqB (UPF0714/DUF867 family)
VTTSIEHVRIEGVRLLATLTTGGEVGLLALHGSNEGGTAELARSVAERCGATSLVLTQPGVPEPVHIPSPRMAVEHCALLRDFLAHVSLVVSLHGHMRHTAPRAIFLGGGNRPAARLVADELAALRPDFDPVTDLDEIPVALRGLHPRNPVNLARRGGVQVELPLAARTRRRGWAQGVPDTPPQAVADALAKAVESLTAMPSH